MQLRQRRDSKTLAHRGKCEKVEDGRSKSEIWYNPLYKPDWIKAGEKLRYIERGLGETFVYLSIEGSRQKSHPAETINAATDGK